MRKSTSPQGLGSDTNFMLWEYKETSAPHTSQSYPKRAEPWLRVYGKGKMGGSPYSSLKAATLFLIDLSVLICRATNFRDISVIL